MELINTEAYKKLIDRISSAYSTGRERAIQFVNTELVMTYWSIGQHIVEFEQEGTLRAGYGKRLLEQLATDLTRLHGKGFSCSNLNYMRLLYRYYPICETLSHKLGWSQYVELVKIDDPLERSFYERQAVLENWNVRELKRHKRSSLFLRLATSKDKQGILELAKQGQLTTQPDDIIRDPYVHDFLKIPEVHHYTESELEIVLSSTSNISYLSLVKDLLL